MAKQACAPWVGWLTLLVGILYLLSVWWTPAFGWWSMYVPFEGVFFVLVGLWAVTKR